jgi:hypothetical protein
MCKAKTPPPHHLLLDMLQPSNVIQPHINAGRVQHIRRKQLHGREREEGGGAAPAAVQVWQPVSSGGEILEKVFLSWALALLPGCTQLKRWTELPLHPTRGTPVWMDAAWVTLSCFGTAAADFLATYHPHPPTRTHTAAPCDQHTPGPPATISPTHQFKLVELNVAPQPLLEGCCLALGLLAALSVRVHVAVSVWGWGVGGGGWGVGGGGMLREQRCQDRNTSGNTSVWRGTVAAALQKPILSSRAQTVAVAAAAAAAVSCCRRTPECDLEPPHKEACGNGC